MRRFFTLLILLLITTGSFGQKISQTFYSLGLNVLKSKEFEMHYDDQNTPPTFFNLGISHLWFRTDKRLTLNKEFGMNLQYSNPHLGSGGLGAHWYSNYKILNLYGEATIQPILKIDSTLSIGLGPTVEYLIIGYNKRNTTYYYLLDGHYVNGEYANDGFNRNFLSSPLLGIKLSVCNIGLSNKVNLKLNCAYFWLKPDDTNFHASGFVKVAAAFGFKFRKHHKSAEFEL